MTSLKTLPTILLLLLTLTPPTHTNPSPPYLLHLTSRTCPHPQPLPKILSPTFHIHTINIDNDPDVVKRYGVKKVPAFVFVKEDEGEGLVWYEGGEKGGVIGWVNGMMGDTVLGDGDGGDGGDRDDGGGGDGVVELEEGDVEDVKGGLRGIWVVWVYDGKGKGTGEWERMRGVVGKVGRMFKGGRVRVGFVERKVWGGDSGVVVVWKGRKRACGVCGKVEEVLGFVNGILMERLGLMGPEIDVGDVVEGKELEGEVYQRLKREGVLVKPGSVRKDGSLVDEDQEKKDVDVGAKDEKKVDLVAEEETQKGQEKDKIMEEMERLGVKIDDVGEGFNISPEQYEALRAQGQIVDIMPGDKLGNDNDKHAQEIIDNLNVGETIQQGDEAITKDEL